MIITLKGAIAAKHLGGMNFYSITVSKSDGITVMLSKSAVAKETAENETVTGKVTVESGYTIRSVKITMGGVDKTAEWYNGDTGAITITGMTDNVTIAAIANVTEEKEETIWYIDHRAQENSFTTQVNIGGRGWCVADTNAAYKKIVGVPINTAHFFTTKATQQVAVMKIPSKNAASGELIATVTANKDASGNFAIIEFPTVTLQQGEYLSLFSADNSDIDFKYATAAVVDANGVSDKDFYTRVPKVYGSGTVWSVAAGSLGWSFGYKD